MKLDLKALAFSVKPKTVDLCRSYLITSLERSAMGGTWHSVGLGHFSLVSAAKPSKKKNSILVNSTNFVDFRPPHRLRQARVAVETAAETKELSV